MNKNSRLYKITALLMSVSALALSTGCGQLSSEIDYSQDPINMETNDDAVQNFAVTYSEEAATTNPYLATSAPEVGLLINLYDSLTSISKNGDVVPSVASSWEHSDDYRTWTFHMRDDCLWVNYKGQVMGTVKAQDYVTGLEFECNYAKSGCASTYMIDGIIEGTHEYQEYTMSISEEEAKALPIEAFTDMVGISAPDDTTVVIRTVNPCSFVPSLVAGIFFAPLSQEHVDEVGMDAFIINSYDTAWYNGPYLLTEYISNNERIMDANPHWYGNSEHTRFKSVTYKCVESSSMAYQLYRNGEIDEVSLSQSQLKHIMDDKDCEYYGKTVTSKSESFSEFMLFNFDKKDDENWNKAVANTAFRQSFIYGLNVYPMCMMFNRANPEAVDVKTLLTYGGGALSDGTDYKDVVLSKLNYNEHEGSMVKNPELFEKYKKQAIEELSAEGVTFPVDMDYYVPASSNDAINTGRILKAMFEDSLGDDFVRFNIKTYTSSYQYEVASKGLQSMCITGYGFDYRDPSNVLGIFMTYDISTYIGMNTRISVLQDEEEAGEVKPYRQELMQLLTNCRDMYNAANSIMDNDERMQAFSDLEVYIIENGIFAVPCCSTRNELLTNVDEESMSLSSVAGYNYRYVDVKTHKRN